MHAITKGLIFKGRRRTLPAAMLLALLVLPAAGASATAQVLAATQVRFIAPLRSSDTPEGSHVTITADLPLDDCSSYQYEGRFYVFIPQANIAFTRDELIRGRAFTDARLERRGSAIVLSFGLVEGASARLERRFNRLDIFFHAPPVSATAITRQPARTTRRHGSRSSARRRPPPASSALMRRASFASDFAQIGRASCRERV